MWKWVQTLSTRAFFVIIQLQTLRRFVLFSSHQVLSPPIITAGKMGVSQSESWLVIGLLISPLCPWFLQPISPLIGGVLDHEDIVWWRLIIVYPVSSVQCPALQRRDTTIIKYSIIWSSLLWPQQHHIYLQYLQYLHLPHQTTPRPTLSRYI